MTEGSGEVNSVPYVSSVPTNYDVHAYAIEGILSLCSKPEYLVEVLEKSSKVDTHSLCVWDFQLFQRKHRLILGL